VYPTKAVVTQVIGDRWRQLAEVTLPTHKAYADRLGAALVVFTRSRFPTCVPYDKYQLYHVLSLYDRAIFLDADTIVRPDCPNLFIQVPEPCVGGFNELAEHAQQKEHLERFCQELGIAPLPCPHYLNTGVLVVSAAHRELFADPERVPAHLPWPDQTHLNVRLLSHRVPVHFLPWNYNCMHAHQCGNYLRESFIIHYSVRDMDRRRHEAQRDLAAWHQLAGLPPPVPGRVRAHAQGAGP
jgi:lipopolysaccharide biosynthesis glycosyltransferase